MSRKVYAVNFAASYGLIAAERAHAVREARKVLGERGNAPRPSDL